MSELVPPENTPSSASMFGMPVPVPMRIFEGVLTMCISEYCWCISKAILASKFLFTRLVPVSGPGVFFNALGTFVLCRCTYYARVETGLARRHRVYFLTRALCILLERAFLDGTCGNKSHMFAASVFWQHMFSQGQAKRTFNSFEILRVSTRFGDFNASNLWLWGIVAYWRNYII